VKHGDLLTIAEVEAALNVKGPRVHQLLADGQLEEVDRAPGRQRHVAGAQRVKAESVIKLLEKRQAAQREQTTAREHRTGRQADVDQAEATPGTTLVDSARRPLPADRNGVNAEVAAARAAAQELKVRLDAARDEVRRQRARNDRLVEIASGLLELLKDTSVSADQMDDVTDGYSQALTQLISPDAPPAD
jgi:hypothetical protein